jgi:hypothetical protein
MRTVGPLGRRLLLQLSTWLLGAVVATAVGFSAWQMIGDRVTDRATPPLSQRAVNTAAASAAGSGSGRASRPRADAAPAAPKATASTLSPSGGTQAGSPSRTSTQAGQVRSFSETGGLVAVRCQNGRITLLYAVPHVGYSSEVSNAGPDRVEVEFQDRRHHSHVSIRCVAGVPTQTVDERSGGGDDSRRDR